MLPVSTARLRIVLIIMVFSIICLMIWMRCICLCFRLGKREISLYFLRTKKQLIMSRKTLSLVSRLRKVLSRRSIFKVPVQVLVLVLLTVLSAVIRVASLVTVYPFTYLAELLQDCPVTTPTSSIPEQSDVSSPNSPTAINQQISTTSSPSIPEISGPSM